MRTPAASRRPNVSLNTVPEIQEEEEIQQRENVPPEKIYVAVGKDMVQSEDTVRCALQNLANIRSATVILLHIRASVRFVPSEIGRLPVNQVSKDRVADYIKKEQEEIDKFMKKYLEICSRFKVKAEELVVEKAEVSKGIVEVISEHGIGKLVMGTTSAGGSISNLMKRSGKANYVQKHALESCEVSIVCKGKLVPVSGGSPMSPPSPSVQKSKSYKGPLSDWLRRRPQTPLVSRSSFGNQHLTTSMPYLQAESVSVIGDNRARLEEVNVGSDSEEIITEGIYSASDEENGPKPDTDEPYLDTNTGFYAHGNSSSTHTHEGSEELYGEIESLKLQLREETEKRKKAEAAAIKATKKFKDREAELQTMGEALRSLETKANEISWQRLEIIEELEAARTKLAAVEAENRRILQEKNAAVKELNAYLESSARIDTATSSSAYIQFREYSFDDIKAATSNFADHLRIGKGGYGMVYKGEINETPVAIKILKEHGLQGMQEFQREIDVVKKFSHPHLVSIVGACFERGCILYEYMSNGSLRDRLFCKNATPPLPWHARFRIAAEVCSGLQFLHTSKPKSFVHRDLKPENILLDENLVSKISDFGLARPIREDLSVESLPKGTIGYMDPEYLLTLEFTPKSDLYSLGVVILQLLTGKPAPRLVEFVKTARKRGELKKLLDPSAGEWPIVQATELAKLALRCTEQDRNKRPDLHPTVMNILDRLRIFAVEAPNRSPRGVKSVKLLET